MLYAATNRHNLHFLLAKVGIFCFSVSSTKVSKTANLSEILYETFVSFITS
jgi:hypothetical protein